MATIKLEFSPEPAHVRTARLVGVAVARRAGVSADQLDEVRLAIGEACGRAVARHQRLGIRDAIEVDFSDGEKYQVRVVDKAGDGEPAAEDDDESRFTVDVSATLLRNLVKDLVVRRSPTGPGTEVRMEWPVRRPRR